MVFGEIMSLWIVLTGEARIDTSYYSHKKFDKIRHNKLTPFDHLRL